MSHPSEREARPAVAAVVPHLLQRMAHDGPLPALLGEGGLAAAAQPVVLAGPAAGGGAPRRLDVAETLEAMEERIQHPVAPLQLAVRQLADAPEDRVPVRLAVREDPEDERRRGRRDEVFAD